MVRKTIDQLRQELAELKAEESRQEIERQVKALRAKVFPSKLTRIEHGIILIGKELVAGARAFDNGLKWLEEEADL
jgi:cell division protein FtsB